MTIFSVVSMETTVMACYYFWKGCLRGICVGEALCLLSFLSAACFEVEGPVGG